MAAPLSFSIKVFIKGADVLPEMAARCRDLRPAFETIVQKWAKTNQDKFNLSAGQEAGGAEIDPEVYWLGLKPSTMKKKRALGQANQIMVATGALEQSLTDPDRFFHEELEQQAAFGIPHSPEDEAKIRYNWPKDGGNGRQAIFLSVDDQRMIEKTVIDYLSLGGDFEGVRFAQGLSATARRAEAAQMNLDFADAVGAAGDFE